MNENELATKVIGLSFQVHSELGPVLLENAYKRCLYYEIVHSGLLVEIEKPMPLVYKDVKMECGYRFDLLVENKLVVETKSVECFNEIHIAQTLTYLKLGNYKLGLLMNFNVVHMKTGIKRIINGQLIPP